MVQRAMRSARGTSFRKLLDAERDLLAAHATTLLGPLAAHHRDHGDALLWDDGWLAAVEWPSVTHGDPNPRPLLERAREAGVLARCRAVGARRTPLRLSPSVTELSVQQAVITASLLDHGPLHTLRVAHAVASCPLRHAGLARLTTSCLGPVPELLESADLPSLDHLHLTGIGATPTSAPRLATALARLPARRLALEILGATRDAGWTSEDITALAPIADRVFGLSLRAPFPRLDVPFPNLRRLGLHTSSAVALPDALACDDLFLVSLGQPQKSLFTEFPAGLGRTLRTLHWSFSGADPRLLLDRDFEALEELALLPFDTRHAVPAANELIARGRFPRVRAVALHAPQQIPALASSPLARQVEELTAPMLGGSWHEAWLDARRHFHSLRILRARDWHHLSIPERAALTEAGHDVHWAQRVSIGRRPDFEVDAGAGQGGAS